MRTVYMIRPADEDVMKIGISDDPVARLEYIQQYCWKTLYLVGVLPGVFGLETWLHKKYAKYKLYNEWYSNAEYILMQTFQLNSNEPSPYGLNKTLIWHSSKYLDWEEEMHRLLDRMKLEDI